MTVAAKDLYDLVRSMRYDLTALQAKVTDLTNMLNEPTSQTKPPRPGGATSAPAEA